jgi:hypothetical protein
MVLRPVSRSNRVLTSNLKGVTMNWPRALTLVNFEDGSRGVDEWTGPDGQDLATACCG